MNMHTNIYIYDSDYMSIEEPVIIRRSNVDVDADGFSFLRHAFQKQTLQTEEGHIQLTACPIPNGDIYHMQCNHTSIKDFIMTYMD